MWCIILHCLCWSFEMQSHDCNRIMNEWRTAAVGQGHIIEMSDLLCNVMFLHRLSMIVCAILKFDVSRLNANMQASFWCYHFNSRLLDLSNLNVAHMHARMHALSCIICTFICRSLSYVFARYELHIRYLPKEMHDLFEKDRVTFYYLFDQVQLG